MSIKHCLLHLCILPAHRAPRAVSAWEDLVDDQRLLLIVKGTHADLGGQSLAVVVEDCL